MKTILLYGFLGRQFGRVHHYQVASPAEAVRALCATLAGFRQALVRGGAYRVLVGGKQALSLDQVPHPVSERESIRIVPVIAGAGKGGGKILLAAAIVVAAFYTSGASLSASGAVVTTAAGSVAFGVANALFISGVADMLFQAKTPEPGSGERPQNMPSYAFDGAVNTVAQGNPVPLLYGGPLIVGSQVVSAGLSVESI